MSISTYAGVVSSTCGIWVDIFFISGFYSFLSYIDLERGIP